MAGPTPPTTPTSCAGCTSPRCRSFLAAFQSYAATPLTDDEADLFVDQTTRAASSCSVRPTCRTPSRELEQVIDSYRPELESTPAAREATRFMLLNPPVPLVLRPGYALIAAGAVALLPDWARRSLRLPLPGPGLAIATRAGAASAALVRWGMAGLEDRTPGDRRSA